MHYSKHKNKREKMRNSGNLNQYSYISYSYISKIIFLLTCAVAYKRNVSLKKNKLWQY